MSDETIGNIILLAQKRIDEIDDEIKSVTDLMLERVRLEEVLTTLRENDRKRPGQFTIPPSPIAQIDAIEEMIESDVGGKFTVPVTERKRSAPIEPPSTEEVRDWIVATKGEPFTRSNIAKHFGYSPEYAAEMGGRLLKPFIESKTVVILPKEEWITRPGGGGGRRPETYKFVKPSEVGISTTIHSTPGNQSTRSVSEPVPGTGKKGRVNLDSELRSLVGKATPRPTIEANGAHRQIVSSGMKTIGLSNTPSDENYVHQVRREMISAGYTFD